MERRKNMDQDYIEITEKTVEDAITAACQRLSVTSDRLDYTVVSEGSSGFLGFNAKNAVIKARVKDISERTEAVLNDVLNKADQKIKDDAEAAKAAEKKAAAEAEAKAQAEAAAKAEAEKSPQKKMQRHTQRHRRLSVKRNIQHGRMSGMQAAGTAA